MQVDLGLDEQLDGPGFSDEDRKMVATEAEKARAAVQAALQAALGGLRDQVEAKQVAYRSAREDIRQVAKKRKGAGGEAKPVAAAGAEDGAKDAKGAAANRAEERQAAAHAGDAAGSAASSSSAGSVPLRTEPPPGATPAAQ